MKRNQPILVKDLPIQYKLNKQEYKLIEKYIETLDYIEAYDYAKYPIPDNVEDINTYKTNFVKKVLRRKEVALVLKASANEVMAANTASAQEVLYFFTKVMRGEVKDQFGLDAPLSERIKAATELARRTVDLENKAGSDTDIHISIDWHR